MSILCTHPGRYGDLLWALPTMRALAEQAGEPVTLQLSAQYSSDGFRELLVEQDYIANVIASHSWQIQETAPITPRVPPIGPGLFNIDRVVHLGYEGWPSQPLPHEVARLAGVEIDLTRPWISTRCHAHTRIAIGFTEEHFELKVGLLTLLRHQHRVFNVTTTPRWRKETLDWDGPTSWLVAARRIANAPLFVGCCSALHVLACAVGTPVIIVEPNPARHHPIFYPLGTTGRVQLLLGNDGQPTVDARHLHDAIVATLKGAVIV